jgi:hypothetical protein
MTVASVDESAIVAHERAAETLLPNTRTGLLLWSLVGVAGFALVSVIPVATYLILLALFGFAHVLTELRYVDGRFSSRLGPMLLPGILGLIAMIAIVRSGVIAGLVPVTLGIGIEIAIGAGLAALAAVVSPARPILIGALVLLFAVMAIASPLHALMTMALLHNLTPLGFFAEALPPREARTVVGGLTIPFLIIPLFIATGVPREAMMAVADVSATWVPLAGPAARHYGAFLPPEVANMSWAIDAFAAAVFAQIMHYLAVIVVLPRVAKARRLTGETLVPWPRGLALLGTIGGLCALLFLYFMLDYAQAKAVYSTFAAIHAWIEVPILLLAVGGGLSLAAAKSNRD